MEDFLRRNLTTILNECEKIEDSDSPLNDVESIIVKIFHKVFALLKNEGYQLRKLK